MSGVTVADAMTWLYGQLPASVSDNSVLIAYGLPDGNSNDLVVVAGVDPDEQVTYAALGSGRLEENYRLYVDVDVYRGGTDFQAAHTRAATLVDAVVAPARADLSFGGLLTFSGVADIAWTPSWDAGHKGVRWVARVAIACKARI